jgi:hypothetical protein
MTDRRDQSARVLPAAAHGTVVRRDYKDALRAIVSWHEDCLNCGKPDDQKTARTIPNDDDLCELFNRIDRARKLLAMIKTP